MLESVIHEGLVVDQTRGAYVKTLRSVFVYLEDRERREIVIAEADVLRRQTCAS